MIERFSLVRGSPSYRLLQRIGVASPGCRAALLIAVAWLPLAIAWLVASAHASVPRVSLTALGLEIHTRFLLAIALLMLAEATVGARTRQFVEYLLEGGIVGEEARPGMDDAVDGVSRLIGSVWPELLILAAAYALAQYPDSLPVLSAASGVQVSSGALYSALGFAGWWHTFVSLPIYDFLLLAWLWRLFVWSWFLRRASLLPLNVNAVHPDRAAGLGFVSVCQTSFWPVALAGGSVASSAIWQAVLLDAGTAVDYNSVITAYLVIALVVTLAPLAVLCPLLFHTKVSGILAYGELANAYIGFFRDRWMIRGTPPSGELLGSSDIQSMADLVNTYDAVQRMKIIPLYASGFAALAASALAPMLPLILTTESAKQGLERLLQLLL